MACLLFNEYRRRGTSPQRKLELESLLMAKHRGLVCSIARSLGCPTPDARQEGMIALLTGIRHFRPSRGTQPSTYLYWPIYNAIKSWRSAQASEVAGGVPLEIVGPFAAAEEKTTNGYDTPDDVVRMLKYNTACLTPRDIALLRSLYMSDTPQTIAAAAEKRGVAVLTLTKKVRQLLVQLKKSQL